MLMLSQADAEVVGSCLEEGKGGMKRAMLELVASCRARPSDLMRYTLCTLLHAINAEVCLAQQRQLHIFAVQFDIDVDVRPVTLVRHAQPCF